jgi:cobalt-zinc-cadmium efflux system outer membrane protein
MSIALWRLAAPPLAALLAACSIGPIKLDLAADHPAQPRAQAKTWLPENATLSVDDAVRLALLHAPALQAQYAQLGIARAEVIEATTIANPVLSLERRSSGIGVERGVGLMQDLLGLVTLPARKQLAERNLAQAEAQSAQRVLEHAASVRNAYYTLQGDAQALELLRTAAQAAQAAAELARRQQGAGNISRLQRAQHEAFHAQTQLELAQTEARLTQEREKLNTLLGAWGANTSWRLPQRLEAVPARLPLVDELEAGAIAQRLDLAAAKRALESTQAALAFQQQHRWLSALGIGFSRTHASDGERLRGPSVEIGLPLFDRAQGQIARLQASAAVQEQTLRQLAVDIRAQARAAHARLAAAHTSVRRHETELLPLHETIVAETQLRYNGMLVDVYELLNAKRSQLAVARAYVDSLRDYWLAQVELERAMGMRLEAQRMGAPAPPQSPSSDPEQPTPTPDAHEHHHK